MPRAARTLTVTDDPAQLLLHSSDRALHAHATARWPHTVFDASAGTLRWSDGPTADAVAEHFRDWTIRLTLRIPDRILAADAPAAADAVVPLVTPQRTMGMYGLAAAAHQIATAALVPLTVQACQDWAMSVDLTPAAVCDRLGEPAAQLICSAAELLELHACAHDFPAALAWLIDDGWNVAAALSRTG